MREKRGWNLNTRHTHESVSKQEIIVIITVPITSFLFIDLGSLEMCYYSLAWPVCALCRTTYLPSRVSNLEKNARKWIKDSLKKACYLHPLPLISTNSFSKMVILTRIVPFVLQVFQIDKNSSRNLQV